MKKVSFNFDWTLKKGIVGPFEELLGGGKAGESIVLPHDAMVLEDREAKLVNGTQQGFYPARSYTYLKQLFVPESWKGQTTLLEFEGVQRKARVYLNGEFVAAHNNGYTGFYADLTPHLRYGRENVLKVLSINEDLASRWYPGSGIYRDVWLWQGSPTHFLPEKQWVTTERLEEGYAVLRLEGTVANGSGRSGKLRVEGRILSASGEEVTAVRVFLPVKAGEQAAWHTRLTVDAPQLWSTEHPSLYRLELALYEGDTLLDTHEETFGIRTLSLDTRKGLCVNGETVKLRGACIHHDNGIIGAATYYDAEYYRLKKMKDAGFNALRSAHHPMSKAMLRACDTLGVLVMDEFSDMWQEPKNANDWASEFDAHWKQTLEEIVDKDYNHPCVVLYSTGNEIPELAQITGAAMGREIAEELRRLDPSRYTTFGMNGFLTIREYIPMLKAQMEAQMKAREAAGSEGLNAVMGDTQENPFERLLSGEILDTCVEMAISGVDVVGYNYMTGRHATEPQRYPHHVVVGSETFPREIATLWEVVTENSHVIGDFTWTGYDYLGEAGIGIPHYQDTNGAQGVYPDRLAFCGDIDLNGTRRPVSYLREIAYGLRRDPFIAVERVDKYGLPFDDNNWKYPDSIDSWTFPGWEGKSAVIRVLANSQEVELLQNGESLGRVPVGEKEKLTAFFHTTYQPGELKAIAWENGEKVGEMSIATAGPARALKLEADRERIRADGQSLAFVTAQLVDEQGRENRWDAPDITVALEGPGKLLAFGSACPSCEGSYQDLTWKPWDGKVMAVIRSDRTPGELKLRFAAEGLEDAVVTVVSE